MKSPHSQRDRGYLFRDVLDETIFRESPRRVRDLRYDDPATNVKLEHVQLNTGILVASSENTESRFV